MLLDEDPAALIASCAANFNIHPDRSALLRISDSLSTLSSFRQHHLQSHTSGLTQLQRRVASLESQHRLAVEGHSMADHASEILKLDTEKFRIAKGVKEVEIEGERLEGEVENLRHTLQELESDGVEGAEMQIRSNVAPDEEATVLKLRVYRSLGIDVDADKATGEYNRAVIRNATKGDVHVVNIDPKFSRYFYANYFWSTL